MLHISSVNEEVTLTMLEVPFLTPKKQKTNKQKKTTDKTVVAGK